MGINTQQLWFLGNEDVELRTAELGEPGTGEVLVRVENSAVSAGTEMMVYRGELEEAAPLDQSFSSYGGSTYPLRYGYASVGTVAALGSDVSSDWMGKRVFSFQPHGEHYTATPNDLQLVPKELPSEVATLFPTMETALSLVQEARPLAGETCLVAGQGMVGLAVTALLEQMAVKTVTLDPIPLRRKWSTAHGAASFHPDQKEAIREVIDKEGADLIFDLSGNPQCLSSLLDYCGYDTRIILGSWLGNKSAEIHWDTQFHRNHVRIVSAQVSRIPPHLSGRWSKERRSQCVWEFLNKINTKPWVTHRYPFAQAKEAYHLLASDPSHVGQVILEYPAV